MAKLTILEALQLSLNATKKYVDDKIPHYNETLMFEISGNDYSSFMNNNYFNMSALNIDETKSYIVKNKFSINDDKEYTIEFIYNKENDTLINEYNQLHIYNHKSYNGTNLIEDVNSAVLTNNNNITPMVITMPEYDGYFRLYEIDKVELDNKCLPNDVNVPNSLTVGNRIGDIGVYSTAEGNENKASGTSSHAEGEYNTASSYASHAEGSGTTSRGNSSHAEGSNTVAGGDYSHAEGYYTIASSNHQHAQGKYNIEDREKKYAHIVGNGTSSIDRSNAHTLDWNGNGWYKGKLSQDGTPTEDKDLTTKKYVDDKVAGVNASTITGLATVATSGSYNDLTNKPIIPSIEGLATETYVNNKLSSMPKSLAGHNGAQVLSYIDKHNILERENMIDKAFQVFTSLFYSTSIPASGDISNLSVNVVDFVNTIMNACTEFGEDIFLYFDFIFDSPIKFVVMPYSSNNMFAMIIDDGMTRVALQIEFTGDGTGEYTKTSTELVTSNEIATVATSGDYNDLTNKPTIPTVTNDLTNTLKSNYDTAYTHSQSAHAPSNAQANADITKAEIEAKLTGDITTHTHSQYLTSIPSEYITEQELTSKGYATESQINSAVEAAATTHEEVKTTVNQILGGAYIE